MSAHKQPDGAARRDTDEQGWVATSGTPVTPAAGALGSAALSGPIPQDDDRLVATAVRRLRRGEPAVNVLALFQQP